MASKTLSRPPISSGYSSFSGSLVAMARVKAPASAWATGAGRTSRMARPRNAAGAAYSFDGSCAWKSRITPSSVVRNIQSGMARRMARVRASLCCSAW